MESQEKSIVLIVDDTIANIKILDGLLRPDFQVHVATNGPAGLKLAFADPQPDIILLDITMPEMDGYEVCQRLKDNPKTKRIPVVFISAHNTAEDEGRGLDLGAVDYITKPFEPRLVRSRVFNHVALKKQSDHLNSLVRERTEEVLLSRTVTLECLATLMETRDHETGGHVRRTQMSVDILARRLSDLYPEAWGVDEDTLSLYKSCAPLHDVGKVGIPDNILQKPGKLTPEEFEIMKDHTTLGYKALAWAASRMPEGSNFLSMGAMLAHSHHERWDGKGYPQSLAGDDIPKVGRLMALADVYDALISKRVYKPAMTHAQAKSIIIAGKGSQFDPRVVEAFLAEEEAFIELRLEYIRDELDGIEPTEMVKDEKAGQ